MVNLNFFLVFFTLVFAVIGSLRGWAKELLVTFSVILAIFIVSILESLVPGLLNTFTRSGTQAYFWLRAAILALLVFFGYQTPNLPKIGGARFQRERLQDALLGFFLGALNGFLVVGSLWYYMKVAGYPFPEFIRPPVPTDPFTVSAFNLEQAWLAPLWFKGPLLYVSVALAFMFVLVVLI